VDIYNRVAKDLIGAEQKKFEAWKAGTETAKKQLRSHLVQPLTTKFGVTQYAVNFDFEIQKLMHEAKYLQLLGFQIPHAAQVTLLLDDKLKLYNAQLNHLLTKYNRLCTVITPDVRTLLEPHIKDADILIKSASTIMTWTSLNIDQFLVQLQKTVNGFESLVNQVVDIQTNRINRNISFVDRSIVLLLPQGKSFSIKEFEATQNKQIDLVTKVFESKNKEVEQAVQDMVSLITSYPISPSIQKPDSTVLNRVHLSYQYRMRRALTQATRNSLNSLKRRLVLRSSPPLFDVELSLRVPDVVLTPTLSEIQTTLNTITLRVLHCTQSLYDWGYEVNATQEVSRLKPKLYYEKVAASKELAVVMLRLTSVVYRSEQFLAEVLSKYNKFKWLWIDEPEKAYATFSAQPGLLMDDYIIRLQYFSNVEAEIRALPDVEVLSMFNYQTAALKNQLITHEIVRWKMQFSEQLHLMAKREMDEMFEKMHDIKSKLQREIKDFSSLKFIMDTQAEIRDVQSWVDAKFEKIVQHYNTLDRFLPPGMITKEEMDAKSVMQREWDALVINADKTLAEVNRVQGNYKSGLEEDVRRFRVDVVRFREDFDANGPSVPGTQPVEAITRLKRYKRELEANTRKFEVLQGGEKLFGLPESEYPLLIKTQKEMKLLVQLYDLYQEVINTIDEYKGISFTDVVANIEKMNTTVEGFSSRCKKLPKVLREWKACKELTDEIENFIAVLPLLTQMSNPSMRPRHWDAISLKTGTKFEMEKFHELKLKKVLESNLLQHREDIEEICDGAEKQLSIEVKLQEIEAHWAKAEFNFGPWKERGFPEVILKGDTVTEIVEQLEEAQANLIQMLTQKHVTPFRDQANSWLRKLSDVNETLDSWVRVQLLWMSLEAVFLGGDIARQMPLDTRVFVKNDKEWTSRLMAKAKDTRNVVETCQNEYIKNQIPAMFVDLEKCQKALDSYLEKKRSIFPRFYFVSNPALLKILSEGSDREKVQDCFQSVFDGIKLVQFQGNNITVIMEQLAGYDNKQDLESVTLTRPVAAKGNIEEWLTTLKNEMVSSLKELVRKCGQEFEHSLPSQLAEFVSKYIAQVSLLGIQFKWTSDVGEAMNNLKRDKQAMTLAMASQRQVFSAISELTISELPDKLTRTNVETLVTIQVHQRDVLMDLEKRFREARARQAASPTDFEWVKQMRCYWVPEEDNCVVRVADVSMDYSYEYLGVKERLCVTPLTDRCYISLTQALGMCMGGAPAGPAGTGKTETVKDLGRSMGKWVVVFNCSDQMRNAQTAKIYKGLAQSGSWGCFDEFNRIDLEVLSVVAQQVQAIFNALRTQQDFFKFPGDETPVSLDKAVGLFITMNPGYAGRQELPENLKAVFRSVSMMLPDREIIIKVKLASVGYQTYDKLCVKFNVLYRLCEEQLSKQRHYDFGLRNILSVLRTGGTNLRADLKIDPCPFEESQISKRDQWRSEKEDRLMMRTLRDMNLSKLVADDVDLFKALLRDLFPLQNLDLVPKAVFKNIEEAMAKLIQQQKYIHHGDWVEKIVQLYETSLVRHGLMMIGPAGAGKTVATEILMQAITECGRKHTVQRMNPKAITAEQMFGQSDKISGEWTHGVFSSLWHRYNDVKRTNTWLICDGPVDAIWIENLNTVLDDNKLLTLANGDRMPMTDNVRIVFEAEDLRNASPATVSRAGIIYVSGSVLGYEPIFECWLNSLTTPEISAVMNEHWQKFFHDVNTLDWLSKNTKNMMSCTQVHLVTNMLSLLSSLLPTSFEADKGQEVFLQRIFLYSLTWALGGLLEGDDRLKFHHFIALQPGLDLPPTVGEETLYDYRAGNDGEWERWKAPLWEYDRDNFVFTTALIPTVDSARIGEILRLMMNGNRGKKRPCLLVGSAGTAKTSIILQYTATLVPESNQIKKINFSSATTHNMFQANIETELSKLHGNTFAPQAGRTMTVFLDDVSMPEVNNWGDQPTLELVRQLVENRGFYSLEKEKRGDRISIENLIYVAAMKHPGGGRNDIPNRLKRHFFAFNVTPPSSENIDNIYGSMLRGRFLDERANRLVQYVPQMTAATIELWRKIRVKMLPTPSKFHYFFTMRDLSRIFQGLLHSKTEILQQDLNFLTIWKHECERVFSDKLTDFKDKEWFQKSFIELVNKHFGSEPNICHELTGRAATKGEEDKSAFVRTPKHYVVDFLRAPLVDENDVVSEDLPKVYEPAKDVAFMKHKCEEFLLDYNEGPQEGLGAIKRQKMDLVLFEDALEHTIRVNRIISLPRGSALLVGVGGSGRQSLTRLAAFIARHRVFSITITRGYKEADFKLDIQKLFTWVGKDGEKVTWIIPDFQIVQEVFLEYINSILATGEVAGLFSKEERTLLVSELRGPFKKEHPKWADTQENLNTYFVERIRSNLHIVMCFSPANEKFAERVRRFPGLINDVTIDWFLQWPKQALLDVSKKFVSDDASFQVIVEKPETKLALVQHIAFVHDEVQRSCAEYFERFRRNVYVTPKSYLAFINGYKTTYLQKLKLLNQQQTDVETGLRKLQEAENDVERMKGELEVQNEELKLADKRATEMLVHLQVATAEAQGKQDLAGQIEQRANATAQQIAVEQTQANLELQAALPYMEEAKVAASSVTKPDIAIVTRLGKPPDLIKRIMDCVLILFKRRLVLVSQTEISVEKKPQAFILDSYDLYAKPLMSEASFTGDLLKFALDEKDGGTDEKNKINEETIELLEPYLECKDFTAESARKVAGAAEGLCRWVRAMVDYHKASLIVQPKLAALEAKNQQYNAAIGKLRAAQASSAAAQQTVDELQNQFKETMRQKAVLEERARETLNKMDAATKLIKSLAGEKVRWGDDRTKLVVEKKKLVGDVALACAFISYCGPFNQEFRKKLQDEKFYKDCLSKDIPVSKDLVITKFLVDDGKIAEWNREGLPKDELSVQNGILVTEASRYPLLIDPQSQGLSWLTKREADRFPLFGTTTINDPKLRDRLIFCIENGKTLLIEGIVNEVDPVLDPVLEKNFTRRGRRLEVRLGDKNCVLEDGFGLFLITKLTNPKFSPELSAKTTIVDFSVTQRGLEDQLLSRVMQFEQRLLEEQRVKLIEDINLNTIKLQNLDASLLFSLSNASGNLLEDVKLIQLLQDTKLGAQEVAEKIANSFDVERKINKRRDEYRPTAARGAVLYFVITYLPQINSMYQTALNQFLQWFDFTLLNAEKHTVVSKRVDLLKDFLTYYVYVNIDRGLFGGDKVIFKLLVTLKILQSEVGSLTEEMINLFLRAGSSLTIESVPKMPKSVDWLQTSGPEAWLNIMKLSTDLEFFANPKLNLSIERDSEEWRKWFDNESPEALPVPKYEDQISVANNRGSGVGHFYKMLLCRSLRPDRTKQAAQTFVQNVLGDRYVAPLNMSFEELVLVSDSKTPIILMLSPGADPTQTLEDLAKRKNLKIYPVSMGEGQEPNAEAAMERGMKTGGWALLQNTHLGLGFMNHVDEDLKRAHAPPELKKEDEKAKEVEEKKGEDKAAAKGEELVGVHPDFRLWITCEPTPLFPVNLLQISIKVTNEPPAGMRAGLHRTFHGMVDQERISRVESREWPGLVWCLTFLHSAMQERRKFGSIGFSVPYEFNNPDLEASLTFLEKHCAQTLGAGGPDWRTVTYMISEVQYGGRITDDFDRLTFNVFTDAWISQVCAVNGAPFIKPEIGQNFTYGLPTGGCDAIDKIRQFIQTFPLRDSPKVVGLHENADITLGKNECEYLLNTVSNTRPKEAGSNAGGKSREDMVFEKCDELLHKLEGLGYKDAEVRALVKERPKHNDEITYVISKECLPAGVPVSQINGFTIPLNIFLYQEIVRLNRTIGIVSTTLKELKQAIKGEIIVTPILEKALSNISDTKPPVNWYLDASGAEIAWTSPSLMVWFQGLLDREVQLSTWLRTYRPMSYWMTGFYNPQGFLTAARQEVCRRHNNPNLPVSKSPSDEKNAKWALDDICLKIEVQSSVREFKNVKSHPAEGVYIHGLYLEGASWDWAKACLKESEPKKLHDPIPVVLASAWTNNDLRNDNRKLQTALQKSRETAAAQSSGAAQAQAKPDPKAKDTTLQVYDCPVYTKPKRNGLSYITKMRLPSSKEDTSIWVMRGVALLASKE